MEDNNIFEKITNSPIISIGVTHLGFTAGILTWVGYLSPLIGFLSVCFGAVVGWYSMRIAYRKWKKFEKNDKE